MRDKIIFGLLGMSLLLGEMTEVCANQTKPNYYRNFWRPQYHGNSLSYCMQGPRGCGACVADRYCQLLGYERAATYRIEYNVGLTNYLLSKAQCKGWSCHGFKLIKCQAKLTHKPPKAYYYRSKQFVFPRFNHYRVDWCYQDRQGCGQRAAHSFCRRLGYTAATQYTKQPHVPATRALGDQRLCFGDTCEGFRQITCHR